jgi:hypothetical protein
VTRCRSGTVANGDSITFEVRRCFSASLEAGYNIKRLADYCGTSVEMIERHYAGYIRDEIPEEILRLGGKPSASVDVSPGTPVTAAQGVKTGTFREPFAARADRQGK